MTRAATPRRAGRKAAAPNGAASPVPVDALGDERFVIRGLPWEGYVAIDDAVVDRPGLRMIYCDGRLTLLTESRKHGWNSGRLHQFVVALAEGLDINWEDAGSSTFRRRRKRGGVEGDETFYFGEHAEIMKGPKDIDLDAQPPPDLAVEVEVSHSANDAVIVWGRLGVPEVWRIDPVAEECSFWVRRRNGTYARSDRSLAFPTLTPNDVVEQLRMAEELGSAEWHKQLRRWVRKVILPRTRGGG
jgi:Uma2 family endonuclease